MSKRICSIDGCSRKHAARGVCITHYYHLRKTLTDVRPALGRAFPDRVDRFWEQVARAPGDGCWEWTGTRVGRGDDPANKYGHITWGERQRGAHRVSWEIHHGPIPDGLVVRHRCDNPPCVRPDHLELGTVSDNNADMWARGNPKIPALRGSQQNGAKLTEAQALAIRERRALGESAADLATEYSVSKWTIYKVAQGTRFKYA